MSRLAYIALWNEADDFGRLRASPTYLRSKIFPYEEAINMGEVLRPIIESGRMQVYEVNNQIYAFLTRFALHQVINRPSASRIPAPPKQVEQSGDAFGMAQEGLTDGSVSAHGVLTEGSVQEGKGREQGEEGEGKGGAAAQASPVETKPKDPDSLDNAIIERFSLPGTKIMDVLRHFGVIWEVNGQPTNDEWRKETAGQSPVEVVLVFLHWKGKRPRLPSHYRTARKKYDSSEAA
jgi:hypothetical protein